MVNLQVFRSIDSNSVKGFPTNPKDAISRVREKPQFFYVLFRSDFVFISVSKNFSQFL